jgi:hypothetical protein
MTMPHLGLGQQRCRRRTRRGDGELRGCADSRHHRLAVAILIENFTRRHRETGEDARQLSVPPSLRMRLLEITIL